MFSKLGCDDEQMLGHTQELLQDIESVREIGEPEEQQSDSDMDTCNNDNE